MKIAKIDVIIILLLLNIFKESHILWEHPSGIYWFMLPKIVIFYF